MASVEIDGWVTSVEIGRSLTRARAPRQVSGVVGDPVNSRKTFPWAATKPADSQPMPLRVRLAPASF